MTVAIETTFLCIVFFVMCYLGTGTDDKNLKSYSSYPDEVQSRVKHTAEYQGKYKEGSLLTAFLSNFILFLVVLFVLGIPIREASFWHNFICLSIMGQGLNLFDLLVIDLLWWRSSKRIRLFRIPDKELYRDPKKHVQSFARALVMYLLVALLDGYLLTLF